MPSRSWARRSLTALLVIVLAGVATWLVHRETLYYGFDYDDYYFLHPHSLQEVLASFHGPWDTTGVMVKFYRPLTVAFSALRFDFFGLNSVAHHSFSLAMFALAAVLVAWLGHRWTSRTSAASIATVFFICHPAMPYSLVAWITNQMHLLQLLVVLGALVWWDAVRARGLRWWPPLLLFGATSFLIKEDGVMLLPAIIALHEMRRRILERELRPVPRMFVGACVLLLAGLLAVRSQALGELGGYGRPSPEQAWANVSGTLYRVFRLIPADREWQPLASGFVTWLPLAALAAWHWISRGARFLLAGGVAIAVVFSLPFIFAAKPEQVYMTGLGFSFMLTGAAVALLDLTTRARSPGVAGILAGAVLIAGTGSLVMVTRDITRDFEPFGPIVLSHDDIVRTWGVVPAELREYLALKREPGAAGRVSPNPIDELSQVTFGVHGRETSPEGVRYMWMSGPRAEIHLRASARNVTIPLRHPIESFREPTRARILADGRPADDLALGTPEWRMSTLPLRPADVPRLSGMHRVRIAIDHAWRPSEVIPGSTDERVLALQIGELTIR